MLIIRSLVVNIIGWGGDLHDHSIRKSFFRLTTNKKFIFEGGGGHFNGDLIYDMENTKEYSMEYRQSHKTLLWIWITLCKKRDTKRFQLEDRATLNKPDTNRHRVTSFYEIGQHSKSSKVYSLLSIHFKFMLKLDRDFNSTVKLKPTNKIILRKRKHDDVPMI